MAVDPTQRTYVSYIDKSREYYAASGYGRPYRWASNPQPAPFTPLPAPLSACRIGLVTTAYPLHAPNATPAPKEPYARSVDPAPARLFTDDLSWDKDATHTDDVETFLPIARMSEWVAAGRVGSLSPRFYGVPTDYSQRRTIEVDAPAIEAFLREDAVDVALLVPL